jgi:hypothetical protein
MSGPKSEGGRRGGQRTGRRPDEKVVLGEWGRAATIRGFLTRKLEVGH